MRLEETKLIREIRSQIETNMVKEKNNEFIILEPEGWQPFIRSCIEDIGASVMVELPELFTESLELEAISYNFVSSTIKYYKDLYKDNKVFIDNLIRDMLNKK